jgi:hypothetical protein
LSRTKKRDVLWPGWQGTYSFYALDNSNYKGGGTGGHGGYKGTQVTTSESHPAWRDHRKGELQGDVGGNFLMRKQYAEVFPDPRRKVHATAKDKLHTGFTLYSTCDGGSIPEGLGLPIWPGFLDSSDATLDAWGSKAIAICKPENQVTNATTALAELYHDGLPHLLGSTLWKAKTLISRKAGDEYLNYQFGFKPMAQDIASFALGVTEFDLLQRQYERDSGKVVRRRYRFPTERTTSIITWKDPAYVSLIPTFGGADAVAGPQGKIYRKTETTVDRWFSGAFTYWVPRTHRFDKLQKYQDLLGIEITPNVLWELTPWSWAVDWFSNAGSVISNYQSFIINGLVMRYGYMMEHTVHRQSYTYVGPTGYVYGDAVQPSTVSFVAETKKRRKANPFGFGLTMSGLSWQQKAILAALGLSKGVK